MKALHRQLYQGSELGAAAVLGRRERLPPALRSTISPAAGLADSADEGDFLLVWRSCGAAIRSLAFPSEAFGLLAAFGRRLLRTRVLPRAIDDASRA